MIVSGRSLGEIICRSKRLDANVNVRVGGNI